MNEEEIEKIEQLFYEDECFEPYGYIKIYFHKQEQDAIKNLIARNKELEIRNDRMNEQNIKYMKTLENLQKDSVPKSKVRELKEKEELPNTIVGGLRNKKVLNYGIKLGRKQICDELLQEE